MFLNLFITVGFQFMLKALYFPNLMFSMILFFRFLIIILESEFLSSLFSSLSLTIWFFFSLAKKNKFGKLS